MVTAKVNIIGQAQTGTKYVVLYLNNSILIDTIEISGTSWTYDWSKSFNAGQYGVSAKAIDSAQNISTASGRKTFQLALAEKSAEEPFDATQGDKMAEEKAATEKKAAEEEAAKKATEEEVKKKAEEAAKKATEEITEKPPIDQGDKEKEIDIEVAVLPVQPIVPVVPKKPVVPFETAQPFEEVTEEDKKKTEEVPFDAAQGDKSADGFINEIKNKNAWEKTASDQQIELIYDVDKIMGSESVLNMVDGLAQIISNISGQDMTAVEQKVEQAVKTIIKTTKQVQQQTVDNPIIEKLNKASKRVALTAVTATSVASVATVGATGASGATILTYLQFLFTQPLLLFTRRKKKGFGVIYNSVTKLPVDLAVVRVYEAVTRRLVRTRVTDHQGRYEFILAPGKYYINVDKEDFKFPSTLLEKKNMDGQYENLYYGEELEVTEKDAIAKPIPLDPNKAVKTIKNEMRLHFTKQTQFALTFLGPTLAIVSFVVSPQLWVGGVVIAQLVMYGIFKKLALTKKPSSWGTVKDSESRKVLMRSIVRVFDVKFNKLLDSQVTDGKGRYAFLVGNEEYYMTAQKPGYYEQRSDRYDLTGKESGYLVEDFNLKPHHLGEEIEKAQFNGKPFTMKIDLGREVEQEVDGIKKLVRRDGEKFEGQLMSVDQKEVHEDFYQLDSLEK